MSNYQSLQTMVQNRLIDVQSTTTSEVPSLVNKAIRRLESLHNFVVMEAYASFTTTAGERTLGTMPTDFKELRKVEAFYVDNTGNPCQVHYASSYSEVMEVWSHDDSTETGAPRVVLLMPTDNGGGAPEEDGPTMQAQVWPYPDGYSQWTAPASIPLPQGSTLSIPTGEYPILLPYWKFLPDLSATTDQNWFTDNCEDFIVWAATAEGFFLDWDEQRAQMWLARAYGPQFAIDGTLGGEARRIINMDKRRKLGPTKSLKVLPDVYGPRGRFHNSFTQVPGY